MNLLIPASHPHLFHSLCRLKKRDEGAVAGLVKDLLLEREKCKTLENKVFVSTMYFYLKWQENWATDPSNRLFSCNIYLYGNIYYPSLISSKKQNNRLSS